LPLLILGGGGYTIRNVARCWTYETGLLLNQELDNDLPQNEYIGYYAPNFNLHITPSNMENMNSPKDLEKYKIQIFEALREIDHVPSVAIGGEVPADAEDDDSEEEDPDTRNTQRQQDRRVVKDEELEDSDDEDEGGNKTKMVVDNNEGAAGAPSGTAGQGDEGKVKSEGEGMDVDDGATAATADGAGEAEV